MKFYSKRGSCFSRLLKQRQPHTNTHKTICTNYNKRFFQRSHHQQFSKKKLLTPSPYKRNEKSTNIRATSCVGHSSSTYDIFTNEGKVAPLRFSSISSPYFFSNNEKEDATSFSWLSSFLDEEKLSKQKYNTMEEKTTLQADDHPKKIRLQSGAFVVPHPSKAYKGGEDAHFVTDSVLGVADGVGGWADSGVDPALYANKLMIGAKHAVDDHKNFTPHQILQAAYDSAQDVVGSSTACIVSIEGSMLKAANLGDSGFMIVRDNTVVFKSKEQQHSFNFPYQLGTGSTSLPVHADLYHMDILPGDLIILGSDGLFDNMFEEEILNVIGQELLEGDPQLLAQEICLEASRLAHQTYRISPFAKGAQQAGMYFNGGKVDDITVIVSKVVTLSDPSESSSPSLSLASSQEAVVE